MSRNLSFAISTILAAVASNGITPPTAQAQDAAIKLDEIVVTATRRNDTVQNVPLSISAVTPEQVEAQGLKTAQDIARVVPALRIGTNNNSNGNADVAIRGIRSTAGSATTGIYVDDVSLTQRNINNPQAGGTVFPQLFDLERVEVLRGPQGTLYGGSSMGGTVRFITPQPSLTNSSGRVRIEGSYTQDGEENYDVGASFGGPLVENVLGFRVSGDFRKDGGWIDHVSRFTGNTLAENTNSSDKNSLHASLAWKPNDDLKATLSYLYTKATFDDADSYWESIPRYTQPFFGPSGGLGGPPTPITIPASNFGKYQTGRNTNIGDQFYTSDSQLQPLLNNNSHEMKLPSLVIDYAFPSVDFKSITAYVQAEHHNNSYFPFADVEARTSEVIPGPPPPVFCTTCSVTRGPYVPTLPEYDSLFATYAKASTFSQELRLASSDSTARLSWVAGLFYSKLKVDSTATIDSNFQDMVTRVTGGGPPNSNGRVLDFPQTVDEKQIAAYGEATFAVTPKFKTTLGLRYTRNELDILAYQYGALFATAVNPAVDAHITESPVTPKFGLQYLLSNDANLYFNASKGFRPGGANQDLRSGNCSTSVVGVFGSLGNFPLNYGADSLWSYEGGAKFNLWDGRASVKASVFRIDWKDAQVSVTLPCGQPTTITNDDITSQGGEVEASVKLTAGLLASVNVGYTDSKFTNDVGPAGNLVVKKDDRVPYTPEWTASIGAQYNFELMSNEAFVRVDYQYQGEQALTTGPGTTTWQIDNSTLPSSSIMSARAGLKVNNIDWSLFVDNLTNSDDLTNRAGLSPSGSGRIGCTSVSCSTFNYNALGADLTSFRPRTIGLSASFRFE